MTGRRPEHLWLDHVQPTGLVVSTLVLGELGLVPLPQDAGDTAQAEGVADAPDTLFGDVLGWPRAKVAGGFGDLPLPPDLGFALADQDTLLEPTMAVQAVGGDGWQLLVRIEEAGIGLDTRGALPGWEATPHQRFERLLRETGVGAGVLVGETRSGRNLRLVTAPRGETSGWIEWPLAALGTVAGRDMLGGLKLMLGVPALFTAAAPARLPQLLDESRKRQAAVSTQLSGQVLAALHTLLRGVSDAEPDLIRELADTRPAHLYEGLLGVLLRLVFILYAEDRDLMPSHPGDGGRRLYEEGYALRGLLVRLDDDAAMNPDTMDERRGAWGWLLALFGLVHGGHDAFMQGRGGALFDPAAFPFLMGNRDAGHRDAGGPPRVPLVSDGCIHRVLRLLMVVGGERLSYRTLDVEQIGSVYETVMGFAAQRTTGRSLAIKAGKANRTPVFVDLDRLAAHPAADRMKALKDDTGRGAFSLRTERAIRAAPDADALGVALGDVADERASPQARVVPAGTPILQPTDERRRTGSHYTPRELTEPIVRHALAPAFARIGEDATPDDVLVLKVCDPAMGSGAFLVEACRQLGARLTRAWEARPDLKPAIPPDEDEDLHARRLVAQRCLYGVDRNPMAVDLAKLSLWLATLARDHEFSFLDHALKTGDSLVGLTRAQIAGATFAEHPAPSLWGVQVKQLVERGLAHRDAIRAAPDDVALAMQEARHREAERDLANVRLIGDAAIAAFFAHDKPKARTKAVAELADRAGSADWDFLRQRALSLAGGAHPIRPFHWEIEFPEVFARDNPGFDAIVGNPPFAGKNTTIAGNAKHFLDWLQHLHVGAHGNADLVAHFFRRTYRLVREGGAFGLIATNTIGQGDTRETGLATIVRAGGAIAHAVKRLKWPGEAAVVVSVVHVVKGRAPTLTPAPTPTLDGRAVRRVSAYLVEGDLDGSPHRLTANAGKSFQGSILLGMGFTFDDVNAAKGKASSLADMHRLIAEDPRNAEVIKPYLGWAEVSNSPTHAHHRYAIDFFDRPLKRDDSGESWDRLTEKTQREQVREGMVAPDYPDEVAHDWPALIEIVQRLVKPERNPQSRDALRNRWWQYAEKRPGLYQSMENTDRVIVTSSQAAAYILFTFLPNDMVYSSNLNVFKYSGNSVFSILSSRLHEIWALSFGSTMKDDPTYTVESCFKTFPLPPGYDSAPALEAAGRAYYDHRAGLMIARDQGMTPTYNRFHRADDADDDIVVLRTLHAAMDDAVLRAYGWDDLADAAGGSGAPVFLDEATEDDHKYRKRLFWPAAMRDAVLARLLKLNETRAAEERAVAG